MRKSLWIVAVLIAAFAAPNAHAQTYFTYTYTVVYDSNSELSFTTIPISTALLGTDLPSTDYTTTTATGIFDDGGIATLDLDTGGCLVGQYPFSCIKITFGNSEYWDDAFLASDYTTPGTYSGVSTNNDTLVVTAETPEPSTAGLFLIGIVLMILMRKRIAEGLPSSTGTR